MSSQPLTSNVAGTPDEIVYLKLAVEFQLSGWDGTHPPFCRAWFADGLTQSVSQKVHLGVQKTPTDSGEDGTRALRHRSSFTASAGTTIVMEEGEIKVRKGYRYLVMDFHKQFGHSKDPLGLLRPSPSFKQTIHRAAADAFEPELGQLKVNINDVLKTDVAGTPEGNLFKVNFCRDGVFIVGHVTVTALSKSRDEDSRHSRPLTKDLLEEVTSEENMDHYYAAIEHFEPRKKWLADFDKLVRSCLPRCLAGDHWFQRSQVIAEALIAAAPNDRWVRGKMDNFVAGPAIALAMRSLMFVLFAYGGFAYLFGHVILPSCGQLGDRKIVQVPNGLYLLFLAFALWKVRVELRMMSAVLPLRVLVAGFPNILPSWFPGVKDFRKNDKPPSVELYLAWKIFNSFLASFDIFSASLFLARIRASGILAQKENDYWNIESVWYFTLTESQSMGASVHSGYYPTFLQLTVATWLTFFLQVLYSLAYSVPTSWEIQSSARPHQPVTYDFREGKDIHFTEDGSTFRRQCSDSDEENHARKDKGMTPYAWEDNGTSDSSPRWCSKLCGMLQTISRIFWTESKTNLVRFPKEKGLFAVSDYSTYTTVFCKEQTHARALTAVAKTGRLTQAMEPEYLKVSIEHWKPHEILQAQRQQNLAFVVFMLQKLFNTSMQASLVGISANLSASTGNHAGADPLTVFTTLLSCFLGVGAVASAISSSRAMSDKVLSGIDKLLNADGITKYQEHHEWVTRRTANWEKWGNIFFSLWCLCFLSWCAGKTLMAWHCECGMWNFNTGVFSPSNWAGNNQGALGCVFFTQRDADNSNGGRCNLTQSYVHSHFTAPNASHHSVGRNSLLCSFV